ncbi:hypothetical protein [Natrarchaeobaculum aegyptiacum]|uniref:Uncharacterized protein n=1 Tax=Natrarchaeobaculum aegyptiacum TaxID=745377 RepID=A0A2Z2HVZ3_9EURY|nr:hypothetical protein [Natrarchaeobaculum aegyptiacum]ARS91479.1 hypothetical protein B1756_18290 [Natrarchaeobaculum aegyptiacum]
MNTLEVTDDQYEFVQRLREEISADVVGKYGFVRERDAVQFLIDNLDEEVDIDVDVDFSATDDVATSVDAAIDGKPDPNELRYDEADGSLEDESDSVATDEDDAGDSESETSADEEANEQVETADEPDDADEPDAGGDGTADDDDMLDEMMSLLETHEDKWEESSSADYRYSVTLPDGSTEDVQTKDDVRALLFKNYR